MRRWVAVFVGTLAAAALPGAASAAMLFPLAPGSAWESTPVHAAAPPGDPRLFVAERGGRVRLVEGGVLQPTPFLSVPNVDVSGERGLLSIAFAPDYASSGLLYVFAVSNGADPGAEPGDLRILEYRRSATEPGLADPASARLVLSISHPGMIHNGGQIAFGPDGYLYVTVGDDGNGANAQALGNLLGKVLRIDPTPESGVGYEVPPSNPFVGVAGAKEEIYALGLRNPYRASFAPSGALVVADVGQNTWEEVDAGDLSGANLGWPVCEGACSPPKPEFTDPVFQYPHSGAQETSGCAVVGGHVVRDTTLTGLAGRYLYGDFCRSDLRTLDLAVPGGDPRPAGVSLPAGDDLLGFGEDSAGCLYVLTGATAYRVAPDASVPVFGGPACATRIAAAAAGQQASSQRPRLRLRAARRQKLRGHVKVVASCSRPCGLRANGRLFFFERGASDGSAKLVGAAKSAAAGTPTRLRLVLRVKVRKRAKRALKDERRVTARVSVRAAGQDGKATRKRVRVKLVL